MVGSKVYFDPGMSPGQALMEKIFCGTQTINFIETSTK
jgi:hypothetical protein